MTILLSADFWLVKNVSGRLLAGLRWWNVVDETSQNQSTWKFEAWTQEDRQLANKTQGELHHCTISEECLLYYTTLLSPPKDSLLFLFVFYKLLATHYVLDGVYL